MAGRTTSPPVRTFGTGATRDIDTNKFDYEGFLSPLALERFAEYMHKNRIQRDGSTRDSDNWQKGIPLDAYMKSGWRHFFDWWNQHRGNKTGEDLEESLCALLFNTFGYLHEIRKRRYDCSRTTEPTGQGQLNGSKALSTRASVPQRKETESEMGWKVQGGLWHACECHLLFAGLPCCNKCKPGPQIGSLGDATGLPYEETRTASPGPDPYKDKHSRVPTNKSNCL